MKLPKLLGEGFKRPLYWNKYKVIDNTVEHIRELLDQFCFDLLINIFFQGLKLKITTSKLVEEIFMVSQLMTHLSNTMKALDSNSRAIQ